eukprot:CAMPEP_0176502792 /NCGR_PEP_ID=MMETSP0200_2-20121128/14966_1 /TAXON_ID=947934 /ORGANISM="Chaetoceros sp., Strain GSL56" /LENGTH=1512 /DNA_ID=CAMNT_0017901935 /DNA_START=134 /DNA_END=4672 /DNA_ORIENTATION=+
MTTRIFTGQHRNDDDEPFKVLLEKLASLVNRLKRKAKEINTTTGTRATTGTSTSTGIGPTFITTTTTPPDEETSALGKQTGHVFLSLYLASSSTSRINNNHNNNNDREEWKKQGTIIMDTLLDDHHNGGRLSSGFFHEIANDNRLFSTLLTASLKDGTAVAHNDVMDDLVHWWIQCLTRLNSNDNVNANANDQDDWNSSRILAVGIRHYVLFSFRQWWYNVHYCTISSEKEKKRPQGIERKSISSNHGTNTNDHCHFVKLYDKFHALSSRGGVGGGGAGAGARQYLIRQCVSCSFETMVPVLNTTTTTGANISSDNSSSGNVVHMSSQNPQYNDALKVIEILSPLFYRVVVSSMLSTCNDREDCRLFISLIMEKVRSVIIIKMRRNVCIMMVVRMMDWLTQSLQVFLYSSLSQASLDHVNVALEIGHDFLQQLCEIVSVVVQESRVVGGDGSGDEHGSDKDSGAMAKCIHRFQCAVLGRILPSFVKYSTFTVNVPCLESVLESVKTVMMMMNHGGGGGGGKNGVIVDGLPNDVFHKLEPNDVFYKLAIMSFMMQDESDIVKVLEILSLAIQHRHHQQQTSGKESHHGQIMVYGILASVGFVFQSLPSCSNVAMHLIHYANESFDLLQAPSEKVATKDKDDAQPSHVYDLFCNEIDDCKTKLESLIHQLETCEQNFTIENQCESLLLGLSLLYISTSNAQKEPLRKTVITYLRHLIDKYLHLGRRCLPVLVASIQIFINTDHHEISSTDQVLSSLFELMCSCLAKDSSCAHEVWSILSAMTTGTAPVNVQAMVVRLYPLLCKSNKRLYSRINASLSNYVSHANVSLRIAAAASLCDLAKDDLIRDVSEVIPWVQTFLTDENELVIYFAVTTLYHLIVAEELDFSTVIKVLNKKLVLIDDVHAMVQLPSIVVEALVQLMGLGEVAGASDSEDDSSDDGRGLSEIVISQQVQAAMSGLLNLSIHIAGCMSNQNTETELDVEGNLRILRFINGSIAKYSLERIGLSHEMIRRECQETTEYDRVKQVIEMSFEISENYMDIKDEHFDLALIALSRKVVLFEEDALGPSLWIHKQKHYSQRHRTFTHLTDALKAIPESAEGTLTCFLVNKLVERAESALIHPSRLSLSLSCLQELALPSQFVSLLRKTMDTDVDEKEILTGPCVDLLIAQLRIMRRAADERREYVKFSIELAELPSELFFIELWQHAPQFLESLSVIIPQWNSAIAEELIPYVWSHCSDKLDGDGTFYATAFLNSLTSILEIKDKKTSPMMIKAIYKVVITDVLPLIGTEMKGKINEPIHAALFNCISKIPLQVLLEHKIFDLANDASIRIQIISFLHDKGILQPEDPYLIRAILWAGKEKPARNSNEDLFLWNLSFNLSRAAMKKPMKARSEILSNLLEIMQVYGVRSSNLHLILLLSARWVQDYPLIIQSPALFHPSLILDDQQLGILSNNLNLSNRFMKSVLMLLEATTIEEGQEQEAADNYLVRECFFNIFLSLKNSDFSSLHALVSASQIVIE